LSEFVEVDVFLNSIHPSPPEFVAEENHTANPLLLLFVKLVVPTNKFPLESMRILSVLPVLQPRVFVVGRYIPLVGADDPEGINASEDNPEELTVTTSLVVAPAFPTPKRTVPSGELG
jgi:hypothetical protein